jgi:hypothetical protein
MIDGSNDTLTIHRFSVKEYHRMLEAGLFEDQRVELIEGKIIDRSPIKS